MAVRPKSFREALTIGAIDGVDQLPYDGSWFSAQCSHHVDELNDAEAALALLVLGDERLWSTEALGHLHLRQMLALAELQQKSTQLSLARRVQGVAHRERPKSNAAASAHNPSIGLSHFGIILAAARLSCLSKASVWGGER